MANPEKDIWSPISPVSHTPNGLEIIFNFVCKICRCSQNWTAKSFIKTAIDDINKKVKHEKVLCALSGE